MANEFMICAPASGCGKTTLTAGLLRALSMRGLRVQPYKCGPDFIDTLFHRQAAGRESVNLDTFMASPKHVKEIYRRYGSDADVLAVEGAMGMYDGFDRWHGSAAEIAQVLDIPVILIVDAKKTAYSIAPLLHGFKSFGVAEKPPAVKGAVLNRVASEHHYQLLRQACEDAGVACLGYLENTPEVCAPSRYLGLSLDGNAEMEQFIGQAAREVEAHVDINRLLALTAGSRLADKAQAPVRKEHEPEHLARPVIAVARDEAFNFTYRAGVDALAEKGTVKFFSPLHDEHMPECDLLYLPGGYPELFAESLAAGRNMRESIRDFAEQGGHVMAECGGMMYLCAAIGTYPMCGVLPFAATMEGARLHLGYRKMQWDGLPMRGHEFHYSSVAETEPLPPSVSRMTGQCSALGKPVGTPIYRYKNVIAGYTHWYWAEDRAVMDKFFPLNR